MDNNEFDDIFNKNDIVGGTNAESDTQSEIKPVKLSRMATAGILVVLIFLVMILIITVKGCSLEKKVNSSSTEESQISASEMVVEDSEKSDENSSKNGEKTSVSSEVVTASDDDATSSISTDISENPQSGSSDSSNSSIVSGSSLSEVVLPEFGEMLESKGIVIAKHSYTYEGSYVYGVSLSVLIGDSTQTVQYFCPKKTYDALSSTDTVSVSYQQDSAGNVSVVSISK